MSLKKDYLESLKGHFIRNKIPFYNNERIFTPYEVDTIFYVIDVRISVTNVLYLSVIDSDCVTCELAFPSSLDSQFYMDIIFEIIE